MRSARFGMVDSGSAAFGSLVETAIMSSFHSGSTQSAYYARWSGGEVDLVFLKRSNLQPYFAAEVKWSDAIVDKRSEWRNLISFGKKHSIARVLITTKTIHRKVVVDGIDVLFAPAAVVAMFFNIFEHLAGATEALGRVHKSVLKIDELIGGMDDALERMEIMQDKVFPADFSEWLGRLYA